jgi:hypothetical protein
MQKRFHQAGAAVIAALLLTGATPARADDAGDATAILDKAIKALGGEEKVNKVLAAAAWKGKGTITFMGVDNPITTQSTIQGFDRVRQEFEGDFGGNTFKGVTILAGDKGWRDFGGELSALDKESLANEKRTAYLALIPITVLPLKGKEFKVATIGEESSGGKPSVGIKATGPDGKEFKLYFDKETSLPVKMVAKVAGFMGDEFTQETTFSDYQEMAGIKKATKIQSKRDGEAFITQQITEFKLLETVDPKTFSAPAP